MLWKGPNTEETRVVTLVTRGGNRISSKDSICLLVTCVTSYNFVSLYTKNRWVINVMGSPIDVGGQYPFITFFTLPRLSGKFLLSRYDILAHVMSMSTFRLAPKIGHLERMKRLYDILQRPSTLLSGIEPKNLITLTYQNRNMNRPGLFVEMSKKKFQKVYPNH